MLPQNRIAKIVASEVVQREDAECFATCTAGRRDDLTIRYLSPGTHSMLTQNIEVGIRVGWGLPGEAANFFSDAGFGWRF